MTEFVIGQKWISHAEPELAMGRVIKIEFRTISIYFDIAEETRTYATHQAPLTRVKFKAGDEISTLTRGNLVISTVSEEGGLLTYLDESIDIEISEIELDPNVRFSKPEDRLFTHQFDDNNRYNLRYETWHHIAELASSECRGLYGPRVSLIPHQLYIANEVATRFAPRVLLADEVGLGKTIEAGLILNQQLQTGRASRVLIIVPPALTFQWFVEMIRRFNLHFTILDEERCQQISADNTQMDPLKDVTSIFDIDEDGVAGFNPFDGQQLMLCSLDLFTDNTKRLEQVLEAEWDLVVVDEAHHLHWSPEEASLEYKVVELISQITEGLLLLTATPEQLGQTGHFARLKLLDPSRFHDYALFLKEESQFENIADIAMDLLQGSEQEKEIARTNIQASTEIEGDDSALINALLDRHGTGRVLFRNVRSSIEGFPNRIAYAYPLDIPDAYLGLNNFPESEVLNWTSFDPRIDWLISLLQSRPKDKFLLICAFQETALNLEQKLSELVSIRTTLFHEGMDLVARDRSANYFAEIEQGAQLMICSEIGSEGRNFQFASDLVLFDLPESPDLLEQRIGRLDRIGQRKDVSIHTPFFTGHISESLYHFYENGLAVFTKPNPVAQNIFDTNVSSFSNLDHSNIEMVDQFVQEIKIENQARQENLTKGRDRLLELNSHRPDISEQLVEDIVVTESGNALEHYMEQSFDLFGLESEYSGNQILTIKPTESMVRNESISIETLEHYRYPELPEDGIQVTYKRNTALSVEDVAFLTWESPIVQQAMDAAITDVIGNSTMIAVKHPMLKAGTLIVEVLHIIDCVAPKMLMADRYLPPKIIRSVITPNLEDKADIFEHQKLSHEKIKVPADTLVKILDSQLEGIKQMIEKAKAVASIALAQEKNLAEPLMLKALDSEISRLESLKSVNASIRPEEIDHLRKNKAALSKAINHASIRMDAIRVIVAA
jgi:ATP-dependent helicase HepA